MYLRICVFASGSLLGDIGQALHHYLPINIKTNMGEQLTPIGISQ